MPTLDWRERPKASPLGGFLIQSRAGTTGNFEVVIPWPDGGLAHFARDNDATGFPWHGPTLFGQGTYVGASVTESDFTTFISESIKNLEVAAVREDGVVEHWWRENGGALAWHLAETITTDATGVPALAYTGALFKEDPVLGFDLNSHETAELHLVVPQRGTGLKYLVKRDDSPGPSWADMGGPGSSLPHAFSNLRFVGAAIVLTPMENTAQEATWKGLREFDTTILRNYLIAAAVSDDGGLVVYAYDRRTTFGQVSGSIGGSAEIWGDSESITLPVVIGGVTSQEIRPFRGRPSMVHGDVDVDDSSIDIFLDELHFGNLELIAPAKAGGIHHFWRDNGAPGAHRRLKEGWRFATTFGTGTYDEVSIIQSDMGGGESGNLEVVARSRGQRGFDFYSRDENWNWHGPTRVGPPEPWRHSTPGFNQEKVAPGTSPTSWYTPTERDPAHRLCRRDRRADPRVLLPDRRREPLGAHDPELRGGEGRPGHEPHELVYADREDPAHRLCRRDRRADPRVLLPDRRREPAGSTRSRASGRRRSPRARAPRAGIRRPRRSSTSPMSARPTGKSTSASTGSAARTAGSTRSRASGRRRSPRARAPRAGIRRPRRSSTSPMSARPTGRSTSASTGSAARTAGSTRSRASGRRRSPRAPSPTSWYTPPENIQHIAYVGADDHLVHQCFFFIGGFGGWQHEMTNAGEQAGRRGHEPDELVHDAGERPARRLRRRRPADPRVLFLDPRRRRARVAAYRARRRPETRGCGYEPNELVHDARERPTHRVRRRRPRYPRAILLRPSDAGATHAAVRH